MPRELFADIATLIAPSTLSSLLGRPVDEVREVERGVDASAYSGSTLQTLEASGAGCCERLVLKRVSPEWDYFMRVTDDRHGREVLVWQHGLLDRLPDEVGHAYIACAHDGPGRWAILMRDVSETLLAGRDDLSMDDHQRVVTGLAALHATFWDDPQVALKSDGYNHAWHHYHIISPDAAAGEQDQSLVMPRIVRDGWQRLGDVLPSDLATTLLHLANDPAPLVAALDRYPQTLVHADVRAANLGLERSGKQRLIVLDWALAGRGVAGLDMVWSLLGANSPHPGDRDALVSVYRDHLSTRLGHRFDESWWQPMLDLSMLGGLIRYGWIASRAITADTHSDGRRRAFAKAELDWLLPGAYAGLSRLG